MKSLEQTWYQRSFTKDQFIEAWNNSTSYAGVARSLGMKPGSSSKTYIRCAEESGLSFNHMTGLRERELSHSFSITKKRPIEEYLIESPHYIGSSFLRERLWEEEVLPKECQAPYCPFKDVKVLNPFTGKAEELKLSLDHVNGNNKDNRLENLRILCWHCHSLTDTFMVGQPRSLPNINKNTICNCGKYKVKTANVCRECELSTRKGRPQNLEAPGRKVYYCDCGNTRDFSAKKCSKCFDSNRPKTGARRVDTSAWPTILEMLELRQQYSARSVGAMLGCSGGSVDRWIKKQGYTISRGKVTKI